MYVTVPSDTPTASPLYPSIPPTLTPTISPLPTTNTPTQMPVTNNPTTLTPTVKNDESKGHMLHRYFFVNLIVFCLLCVL